MRYLYFREPLEKAVKLEPLDPRESLETPVRTLLSLREHPVLMEPMERPDLMDFKELKETRALTVFLVLMETMV